MKSRTKSHTHFAALLCAFAASLHCAPLLAQNRDPAPSRAAAVLDSMPHAKKIDQVAVSPDGTQVAYIVYGQLTVTPVRGGSGSLQAISVEGKLPLRDVTWSADSKQLAFLADLPGDIPVAQVWTVAIDGRAPAKRAELKGYVQTPRFSPNGANLAILFTKGLPRVAGPLQPMTPLAGVIDDQIYEQRLTTINLITNHLAQVTPADVYIYEYDWTPDGTAWAATAAHGSGDANWWVARLYRINAQSGEMHEIYAPKWQMEDPHVSPDGKNVALIEGLMSDAGVTGGDIFVVPINGPINSGLQPAWGAMRNIHWQNGSTRVEGWLMLPKGFVAGRTYPLVVSVHGGPSSACMSHWNEGFTGAASAMGYFVLCPNPRGSYGQGEAFTQANIKDFGGEDYRDIMTGIDAVSKQYPIDPKRIGLRGHSYGGYMTMWAETQTQRFAAAVAGAGLSNWLSYYGLNDIDEWMIPFFGASVYDD